MSTTVQDVLDAGGEIFCLPVSGGGYPALTVVSHRPFNGGVYAEYRDDTEESGSYRGFFRVDALTVYPDGIRFLDDIDPDDPERLYRVTGHSKHYPTIIVETDYEDNPVCGRLPIIVPLIPDRPENKCDTCKHEFGVEKADDPIGVARDLWGTHFVGARVGTTTWLSKWFTACSNTDNRRLKELRENVPDDKLALCLASWVKWSLSECGKGWWSLGADGDTCPLCGRYDCRARERACPLKSCYSKSPWGKANHGDKAPLVAALWECVQNAIQERGE